VSLSYWGQPNVQEGDAIGGVDSARLRCCDKQDSQTPRKDRRVKLSGHFTSHRDLDSHACTFLQSIANSHAPKRSWARGLWAKRAVTPVKHGLWRSKATPFRQQSFELVQKNIDWSLTDPEGVVNYPSFLSGREVGPGDGSFCRDSIPLAHILLHWIPW